MFLAHGKTVILFSASNVWSVTALKVRGVLWSIGMHQQKKHVFKHQLHTLQVVVAPFKCLLPRINFFLKGKLIPLQHNCIHNTLCAPVVHVLYSRIAKKNKLFLQQDERCWFYIKKLTKQKKKRSFLVILLAFSCGLKRVSDYVIGF